MKPSQSLKTFNALPPAFFLRHFPDIPLIFLVQHLLFYLRNFKLRIIYSLNLILGIQCGNLNPPSSGILQSATTLPTTYTRYVYTFQPTSASATIEFAMNKAAGAGVFYIDNVSVYDVDTSTEKIINGGFETGSLSGWTVSCLSSCTGSASLIQLGTGYQGTYCYVNYCLTNLIHLSQTISTTVGHVYTVSYYARSSSLGSGYFYSAIY